MKRNLQIILTAMCFALLSLTANAQVTSNPPYAIEQSVIAGGGGMSADTGNTFSITGSIGQAVTGASSQTLYAVKSGFFTAAPSLAPTAAAVSVSGRVLTSDGRGIRNVILIMTDASGSIRTRTTTAFGYYRFNDVAAGETYVITARGKRFTFAQPSQVLNVTEDTNEVNFIGNPAASLRDF